MSVRVAGRRDGADVPAPGETVLSLEDLRVWYSTARGPVHAVDGVDLRIAAGETLGLVGESGSGKSTLGRGIIGLLPPGADIDGRVVFDGQDLVALRAGQGEGGGRRMRRMRGPRLGLVFQEPMTRLDPLMRVSEHFAEALSTHRPGIRDAEIRQRSLEALGAVGLPPGRLRQYPHEFSGGMRQRIMIALTLALEPVLVIADEPTTALDVLIEAQVLAVLEERKAALGAALLLITHNLGIVAEACDRVAVMYAGRIVEEGPTPAVFAAPAHPYTRELLASTISMSTTELHSIPGAPPDLLHPPPGCRFHPRCPQAMRVCAVQAPVPVRVGAEHRTECWLHGPAGQIPPGGDAPLEKEAIAVADEA